MNIAKVINTLEDYDRIYKDLKRITEKWLSIGRRRFDVNYDETDEHIIKFTVDRNDLIVAYNFAYEEDYNCCYITEDEFSIPLKDLDEEVLDRQIKEEKDLRDKSIAKENQKIKERKYKEALDLIEKVNKSKGIS